MRIKRTGSFWEISNKTRLVLSPFQPASQRAPTAPFKSPRRSRRLTMLKIKQLNPEKMRRKQEKAVRDAACQRCHERHVIVGHRTLCSVPLNPANTAAWSVRQRRQRSGGEVHQLHEQERGLQVKPPVFFIWRRASLIYDQRSRRSSSG